MGWLHHGIDGFKNEPIIQKPVYNGYDDNDLRGLSKNLNHVI
jgi:hypothetical protein